MMEPLQKSRSAAWNWRRRTQLRIERTGRSRVPSHAAQLTDPGEIGLLTEEVAASALQNPPPDLVTSPIGEEEGGNRSREPIPLARLYALYAAGFLVATVLAGSWLRASFVAPALLGPFAFAHAAHAHSHIALFGWTNMALFALLCRWTEVEHRWARAHAHATAIASAATFPAFLTGGYSMPGIVISAIHVVLWAAFFLLCWRPTARLGEAERPFLRAALLFLVLSGAASMAPGLAMMRENVDPWLQEFAVVSFLSLFLSGWLLLGVMGAAYRTIGAPRPNQFVLRATLLGALPASLLHPLAAPPADWIIHVGRVGMGLLGVATLRFALDLLRGTSPSDRLLRIAGAAALLKALTEIAVAFGIALPFLQRHSLAIAYLHLVLLGLVTSVLLHSALEIAPAPWGVMLYAGGLALMLAALAGLGLPEVIATLAPWNGASARLLYSAALVGGVGCALGVVLIVRRISISPRPAWQKDSV